MKIKTSELTRPVLDWVVEMVECEGAMYSGRECRPFSSDWAQGGPIIEREKINLWTEGYDWEATQYGKFQEWGSTPLIAAMRCYVASKLGDEVEVPDELVCLMNLCVPDEVVKGEGA